MFHYSTQETSVFHICIFKTLYDIFICLKQYTYTVHTIYIYYIYNLYILYIYVYKSTNCLLYIYLQLYESVK